MAEMHFEQTPYQCNLFGVSPEQLEGTKFHGWKENARYEITMTVIVQIDTTNVSDAEYNVAPNITFLSVNQAIINIYQTRHFTGSFEEFNQWYGSQEQSLQIYIDDLVTRLNSARAQAGLTGNWFINYALDERHIKIWKVEE